MGESQTRGRQLVRFGEVEADLRTGEVRRAGRRIALGDQPLRILVRLLDQPGETVTREELRHQLWADDTFVDFESGLNSAIRRLRDALGDSAEHPRYIETLPRRGYRFIAPVDHASAPAVAAPARIATPPVISTTVAVLAALLLAATATIVWLVLAPNRPPPPVLAPGAEAAVPLVEVNAFENHTADPALDQLGVLTAGRLIRAINRVETVTVVPQPVRHDADASPGAADGRAPPHAALMVTGAYYTRGDRLEFQARILDGRTERLLYSAPPVDCARGEPAAALEAMEQAVAGAVAIHFDRAFGGLEITSQPPRLDAYLEYVAGRNYFERDYPRGIEHLERALEISPGFFLARLTLAMMHDNSGDAGRASAEMARLADRADTLTAAERLLFEYLDLSLNRRPADALRALEALETHAPRSWIVNYSLQMEALILNRPQDAVAAFDRLPLDEHVLRFNAWRLGALARALHHLGEHDRELAAVRRAQAYDPGNLRLFASEAQALAALGRVDEVGRVIDRSLSLPAAARNPGDVMAYAARELRAHGHRDASIAVAGRAVEWYKTRAPADAAREAHRAALAHALYLAERWDEARAAFSGLAAEFPASVDYAGYLGAIAARQGRQADALDISQRLEEMAAPALFGRHRWWRAAIAALLGDRPGAVDLLRDALAEGEYLGLSLHQASHFEPLRGYAPFEDLTRPR